LPIVTFAGVPGKQSCGISKIRFHTAVRPGVDPDLREYLDENTRIKQKSE
jgi:hypothetical protein